MSKPNMKDSEFTLRLFEGDTFIIRSTNVEQTHQGTMIEALHIATEIAYLETEWPRKTGQIGNVSIEHNGNIFHLTISTPRRRARKDK